MDVDELPRPSQDGRVYWSSGHADLLLKQLAATSLNGQGASHSHSHSNSLKRNSKAAELPSPTRPSDTIKSTTVRRTASDRLSDTSFMSNTSLMSNASTTSNTSASASSTASSRSSKRRRQAATMTASTSGPHKSKGCESAVQRINELAALLADIPAADSDSPGKMIPKAISDNNTTVLSETTNKAHVKRHSTSLIKAPLRARSSFSRSQSESAAVFPATRRPVTTTSTHQGALTINSRQTCPFVDVPHQTLPVVVERSSGSSMGGSSGSKQGSSTLNEKTITNARTTETGEEEEYSFDNVLANLDEDDFQVLMMSTSQPQQHVSVPQQETAKRKDASAPSRTMTRTMSTPLTRPQPAFTTVPPPAASQTERFVASQQKLKQPFKAPSFVKPPPTTTVPSAPAPIKPSQPALSKTSCTQQPNTQYSDQKAIEIAELVKGIDWDELGDLSF